MASRTLYPSTPSAPQIKTVAPVNKGGTGGADVVSAAVSLGAISQSNFGQPGGVAQSDGSGSVATGSLPSTVVVGPTLNGPATLYSGQVTSYEITNFDSLTAYTISASAGTAVLSGTSIQYTAPGTTGNVSLTVNGKVFTIVVGAARPATPSISVVASGSGSAAIATFTGSAYSIIGGSGTHASSDWEVYSDVGLTTLVAQSQNDTVNKTSWTSGQIALSTTFYARARYRDSNNNVSDWSTVINFTTAANYTPKNEEAKLIGSDVAANRNFGIAVSLSTDGSRVLIGASNARDTGGVASTGAAYIFLRTGTTWALEQKISGTPSQGGGYFGYAVSISGDGTRLVVGSPYAGVTNETGDGRVFVFTRNTSTNVWAQEGTYFISTGNNYLGISVAMNVDGSRFVAGAYSESAAYVYSRSGTTWTREQRLVGTPTPGSFGLSVAINTDATRIIVGALVSNNASSVNTGAAFIFLRTGTSWAQEAKITPSDGINGTSFGYSVSMSSDASRVAVGAGENNMDPLGNGSAYIFLRTGTSWAQEAKVVASDGATGDLFGSFISMSGDGSRIVTGAYFNDPTTLSNAGAAYIYSRTNTTWSQSAKIVASDKAANAQFGIAVSMSNDGSRIAVGAWQATVSGSSNAGAVYIES